MLDGKRPIPTHCRDCSSPLCFRSFCHPGVPMSQANKRRSIPVVDKAFQYKYTAIIVSIVVVVSAVLGYFLLQSYWEMNRIMDLALASPEMSDKVNGGAALNVFYVSIAFLVFEVLALSVMGLIITHRVR